MRDRGRPDGRLFFIDCGAGILYLLVEFSEMTISGSSRLVKGRRLGGFSRFVGETTREEELVNW